MILPKPALQVARIQNENIMVFIRVSPSQGGPVAIIKRRARTMHQLGTVSSV